MEVKATVQLTAKQMFEFLMRHTYLTMGGFISVILSIGSIAGFCFMVTKPNASIMYLGALLIIGLLFTVIQPCMIYKRAKKQVKQSEAINKPLEYVISKKGIDISQGDNKAFSPWNEIIKITSTKRIVMFYTSRVNAYIIPKGQIEEQMDTLKTLVRENCKAGYIKL